MQCNNNYNTHAINASPSSVLKYLFWMVNVKSAKCMITSSFTPKHSSQSINPSFSLANPSCNLTIACIISSVYSLYMAYH